MKLDPKIKLETGRCVMCGLCLPHCPTYMKSRNEAESPRGRISLINGLATGQLELNDKLRNHLDNCLLCRACEAVCPSGVNYGYLMDTARTAIHEQHPKGSTSLIPLSALAADKRKRDSGRRLMRLAERSGLRSLGSKLGITKLLGLERLEQLAPSLPPAQEWREYYPASGPASGQARGDVALFSGCFSDMFDQQTLADAITLLTRWGYGVHVPKAQNCCGALHHHSGDSQAARDLARQNLAAFSPLEIQAIIVTASGCGSHLSEYHHMIEAGEEIGRQVADISDFLCRNPAPAELKFNPLPERVAVHEPCTLRNILKKERPPYQLLGLIPQLEVVSLPGNQYCCGAAGSYMIDHPQMADSLRDDKIAALQQLAPAYLATSNIGCALHLANGARRAGQTVEVLHPVALLARQLI